MWTEGRFRRVTGSRSHVRSQAEKEYPLTQRPVKQAPALARIEETMRTLSTAGAFLGQDRRRLVEILEGDRQEIQALGLTHAEVAQRLEALSAPAARALGDSVVVEGRYEVRLEEARGVMPCPWGHAGGLFRKNRYLLRDLEGGVRLIWSDLSIHMIRDHGFYQGAGSPYRLEPREIVHTLFAGRRPSSG